MVYSSFPYLSPWGNTHILVAWQVRFLFMRFGSMFVWNQWLSQGKLWKTKRIFSLWNDWFKQSHWKSMAFPCFSYKHVWFTAFFPHENPQVSCSQVGSWTWRTSPAMHSASLLGACVSWWWDMAMVWGDHRFLALQNIVSCTYHGNSWDMFFAYPTSC